MFQPAKRIALNLVQLCVLIAAAGAAGCASSARLRRSKVPAKKPDLSKQLITD